MKKRKVFILISIIACLSVINIFVSVRSQKNDIESVIKTALNIQYGWKSTRFLNDICTDEFMQTINLDEIYIGRKVYSVDKDYMENIIKIDDEKIVVDVHVYSPDIIIHKFTLKKLANGEYLICKIEHDV